MANNVDIKDFTLGTARTMKTRETTGVNTPLHQVEDSTGGEILGTKADAKSTATDTTAVSFMSVWKQVSASVQAVAAAIANTTSSGWLATNLRKSDGTEITFNVNGQTTMSASAPVVVASNQSDLPIKPGSTETIATGTTIGSGGVGYLGWLSTIANYLAGLLTVQYASTANLVSGAITTAMTGTTSTSLIAAPGASLRNYITAIVVSNSHATVGTDVIIQDGSGGTTLMTIPAAAVYGGAVITLNPPLKQPTTNTAIFCANVTTGSNTKVSAVGFKAA